MVFFNSVWITYLSEAISWLSGVEWIMYIYYPFSNLAILTCYLLTMFRLYISFKDTIYKMSKCCILFHKIFIIIIMSFWIIQSVFYIQGEIMRAIICAAIGALLFMFGFVYLVYSFNRNLFKIISNQRSRTIDLSSRDEKDQNKTTEIRWSVHQQKLLNLVVKQTLLAVIMAMSIMLYSISFGLIATMDPKYENIGSHTLTKWMITEMVTTTVICQYLTFSVNGVCYKRICTKCHMDCRNICQYAVERAMIHESNLTDYQLLSMK